jgi:[CysO sulfur-carrier protein]-thiocarboxylate-dependent cysteine synthase
MLELYGANIVTAPGASGSNGAVMLAREMAQQDRCYVMVYQYGNEANAIAHFETMAAEILKDVPDVNVCVAGLGTGGTLTGIARRLKAYYSAIRVVAAEPMQGDSIPGLRNLADGFVPPVLDQSIPDARLPVSSRDAWARTLQLKAQEGIFAGPSSAATLEVTLRVAAAMYHGKIVVILADGGWKYMSEGHWTQKDALQVSDVLAEPLLAV